MIAEMIARESSKEGILEKQRSEARLRSVAQERDSEIRATLDLLKKNGIKINK